MIISMGSVTIQVQVLKSFGLKQLLKIAFFKADKTTDNNLFSTVNFKVTKIALLEEHLEKTQLKLHK